MTAKPSQLNLQQALEAITDMVILTDPDYQFIEGNRAANVILGLGADLAGRKCHELLHGKDSPCDDCPLPETLETGQLKSFSYFDERYGEFFEERTHPIMGSEDDFSGFVITLRNISDLRAAEDESAQSKKLASLGKLTAGAAHDFNNVIAEVMGQIRQIKRSATDPWLLKQLEMLESSTRTGSDTIRRMLDFARGGRVTQMEILDIDKLMHNVIYMTQARWLEVQQKEGVLISPVIEVDTDLYIEGSRSEIMNAVTNLIFNSVDAMPDGGLLTLKAFGDDERVHIRVQDTGMGMTEEVRDRIFDPFFTTKGPEGNGLGMSEVYGTLKRHSGDIDVVSEVGNGTSITLSFRRVDPQPEPEPIPKSDIPRIRVLTVDDNAFFAETLNELLTDEGHSVSTHTSTREALEAFSKHDYDMVITDMEMPEMGGREFAEEIKKLNPDVPVLLLSGWPIFLEDEPKLAEFIDYALAKPFTVEDIQGVIMQAMRDSD